MENVGRPTDVHYAARLGEAVALGARLRNVVSVHVAVAVLVDGELHVTALARVSSKFVRALACIVSRARVCVRVRVSVRMCRRACECA